MERASPEFLPSNAVRPQIVVLDAFCGIKNTGGVYRPTALSYPIAGGEMS